MARRSSPRGDLFVFGHEPLDRDGLQGALAAPELGALATFEGRVRSPNLGKEVLRLEYEGYEELALAVLEQVAEEARAAHGPLRLAVQHRLGSLAPGETSMLVAVAAPHRGPALAACAEAVEACKSRLPVWKLEVTGEGAAYVPGATVASPPL